MAIITLITDWNKADYYIASVKGKILSKNPSVTIIDISHQIPSFNIAQAAFILRNCYYEFPKGTVHIIGVNTMINKNSPLLIIEKEGHFFLSNDNGIAGLLFGTEPDNVYAVKNKSMVFDTFNTLGIFVDIALKLVAGDDILSFSKSVKDFASQIPLRPVIEESQISGSVIYIDSYYNAITNITRELFERVSKKRPFEILIQSNQNKLRKLCETYSDVASGELLALFNSVGLLEIAINSGNAAGLLGLKINSAIRINFLKSNTPPELKMSGV